MSSASTPSQWPGPFFILWSGQAISLLGSRIASFAIVWWLTQETGSALTLTILTLVISLPQIFLGPFAGAITDRWSRRLIMLIADSASAGAAAILMLIIAADNLAIWHIYAVTFIGSICGTLQLSAMSASTTLMVPKEKLDKVQGANQMLRGALIIASPIVGALLVELLPLFAIVGVDVVTASFAILPLLFIQVPQPTNQQAAHHDLGAQDLAPQELASQDSAQQDLAKQDQKSDELDQQTGGKESLSSMFVTIWQDVVQGIQYIRLWRGLLFVALLETLVNFLGNPVPALVPILVTEHFEGTAMHFAWMRIMMGLGLLAGGVFLSIWPGFRRRMLVLPVGFITFGAGIVIIGGSPSEAIWLAMFGIGISGIASAVINGTIMAVLQTVVEPSMQGRVFTILHSLSSAAQPFGLLLAGVVADLWSANLWLLVSGTAIVVVGIGTYFIPEVLTLDQKKMHAE